MCFSFTTSPAVLMPPMAVNEPVWKSTTTVKTIPIDIKALKKCLRQLADIIQDAEDVIECERRLKREKSKPYRSLASINKELTKNYSKVLRKTRANTRKLTGKDSL